MGLLATWHHGIGSNAELQALSFCSRSVRASALPSSYLDLVIRNLEDKAEAPNPWSLVRLAFEAAETPHRHHRLLQLHVLGIEASRLGNWVTAAAVCVAQHLSREIQIFAQRALQCNDRSLERRRGGALGVHEPLLGHRHLLAWHPGRDRRKHSCATDGRRQIPLHHRLNH